MKNADDACSLGKIYTNLNVIVSRVVRQTRLLRSGRVRAFIKIFRADLSLQYKTFYNIQSNDFYLS